MKVVKIIDVICIVLFVALMVYIFALPSGMQELLTPVFSILYRCCAWIIGAGLVITCIWGKGKGGIVFGILLLLCYLMATFITLFALMVLTTEWELLWYVHPVFVIPGCAIALWKRHRSGRKKNLS